MMDGSTATYDMNNCKFVFVVKEADRALADAFYQKIADTIKSMYFFKCFKFEFDIYACLLYTSLSVKLSLLCCIICLCIVVLCLIWCLWLCPVSYTHLLQKYPPLSVSSCSFMPSWMFSSISCA